MHNQCYITKSLPKCNGNIAECEYLKALIIQEKLCADGLLETVNERIIVDLWNYFDHSRACHDNDDEFYYIFKSLGINVCKSKTCKRYQRYYCRKLNDKMLNILNHTDHRLAIYRRTCDQIHCYFIHQYDTGLRCRYHGNINDDDEIKQQQQHLKTNNSKFGSNLNQVKINHNHSTHISHSNNKPAYSYSYSYPFIYWDLHPKDLKKLAYNDLTYEDLSVQPKYNDLKEELLAHCTDFNAQTPELWLRESTHQIQTDAARRLTANCDEYWPAISHYPDHPRKYGYSEGEYIRKENVCIVKIYTSEDIFQAKLKETYREMTDNETLQSIKKRHSEYYHFAKILRETVEVFGVEYMNGNVCKVYHGIRGDMVLNGIQCQIFGPLSTSINIEVAVIFSNNAGSILELVPDPHLKYIDCRPFSRYQYESEILFVGGMANMNIMNIRNIRNTINNENKLKWNDYRRHVQALRIMDTMTNGVYYDENPTNIHKMRNKETGKWILKTKKLHFTVIPPDIQRVTKELMEHKLMNSLEYDERFFIQLLNKMCCTKKVCIINWKSMNVDILDEVDDCGGYFGYDFLKSVICTRKPQRIDINKLYRLFSALVNITVFNLPFIDENYLRDILTFIREKKECKITFELAIAADTDEQDENELQYDYEKQCNILIDLCEKYEGQFKSLQYDIKIVDDKELCTKKIMLEVLKETNISEKQSNDNFGYTIFVVIVIVGCCVQLMMYAL